MSLTSLTPEALFGQLLNEICTEIAFKAFQKQININSICLHCNQQCDLINEKPGLDIYGNKIDSNGGVISGQGASTSVTESVASTINVECPCCKKTLAATRFAPHLEKCMGMGRQSTRKRGSNMMMKMAAGSENDSADDSFDQLKTPSTVGSEETSSQSSQTAPSKAPSSASGNDAKKAKTASPSKAKNITSSSKTASPNKNSNNPRKATSSTSSTTIPSRSKATGGKK